MCCLLQRGFVQWGIDITRIEKAPLLVISLAFSLTNGLALAAPTEDLAKTPELFLLLDIPAMRRRHYLRFVSHAPE